MTKELWLLEKILSISSINGEDNACKIAEFIYQYLKENNVEVTIQYIDDRHANVLATVPGKSKQTVIWNGHLDTVPYGEIEEWDTDPKIPKEKEGKIYARGASDMKSGLAAMVYLLGEIGMSGKKPENTIYFLGTCDEEKGGIGAEKILEQNAMPEAELLLIGEPTGCRLGVAQKGCLWTEISVQGITSHGAYPWEGCNAIEYGIEMFLHLKEWIESFEHDILGNATVQVTMVNGGVAPNMTPDCAKFLLDIRTVPGLDVQMVLKKIEKIGEELYVESGRRVGFDVQVLNERRAIELVEENVWLKYFKECLEQEGEKPEEIGINYFTDASILTRRCKEMAILLFGPGEPHMAHKPNEYVEIEKYKEYIRLLCRIFDISYPKIGK